MKLIVEISEDSYEATCNEYMFPEDVKNVIEAIKKGTPLPEHYGDLIDRDELLDNIVKKNPEWVSETGKRKRYARLVYYWAVKNAKAVIEGSDRE